MKMVCRYDRSSVNPNTVIPALLFSRYVTAMQAKTAPVVNNSFRLSAWENGDAELLLSQQWRGCGYLAPAASGRR